MERELLSDLKSAREHADALEAQLREAHVAEESAVKALTDYLESKGASATGRYPGLGWAKMNQPRLFASYPKAQEEAVFAWLKAQGQESAIKTTVHPSTLNQVISEALRGGIPLPSPVTYYLRPQIRLYGSAE